jgi:hypothetical protein
MFMLLINVPKFENMLCKRRNARGIAWGFSFRLIDACTVSSITCQVMFKGNRIIEAQPMVMCSDCRNIFGRTLHEQDRLCGLVVRVLGYRSGGPGSIPGTSKRKK